MKTLKALRDRKAEIVPKMKDMLAASDEFSAEQEKEYGDCDKELKSINKQIARLEALQDEERNLPPVTEAKTDKKSFSSFGEFLGAVATAERTHGRATDPRLINAAVTGASEGVPADGGFLVEKDMAQEIFKNMHESGEILSRCRRTPVSGNGLKINAVDETSRATGSRHGGVQAYWVDEGGEATAKKPKFRRIELSLHKLMAIFYATDELLEDQTALGAIAQQAFTEELTFFAEDAVIRGSGAGQPLGILNANALVSIAKETSQVAATIVTENVLKMYARLPARSRSTAAWFYNVDCEPQLFQLNVKVKNVAGTENVGGFGVNIFQPAGNGSRFHTLLGRPMIPIEQAETLGTKGDVLLLDLSQYQIIEKAGPQVAESMHVRFLQDENVFRFKVRMDGQPIWSSSLTQFKGSNAQSPYISLDTRS